MKLRALGALVLGAMVLPACRSASPGGATPAYLLDPRIGLDGPFPAQVDEGWRLLAAGRAAEASRAFQSAGGSPAAAVGRAQALLEAGSIEESRSECARAFQRGIGTAPLLAACGEAASRHGEWSEAFDLFEAAALRFPEFKQFSEFKRAAAPRAAADLVKEGQDALDDNEIAEAENAADRALAIDPVNRSALRLSGAAALARDDDAKAFGRYLAAWKLDRDDVASGEQAGDLALKIARYDAGYEIFSDLSRRDARFSSRAAECQEEFVISNWPGADRQSAHAARLTRAQAATLLWRLLPDIRSVPVPPNAPIASDILSRGDRKVLAHCLGIGLLTVDASTHRARPDVFLSRLEAVRLLDRAASLASLAKARECIERRGAEGGLLAAFAACGFLPEGRASAVSGREFRGAIAALVSSSREGRK